MRNKWVVRVCLVVGTLLIFSIAAGAQGLPQASQRVLDRSHVAEVLAEELGISVDELHDALSPMANLRRLAEGKGVSLDELRLAISNATKERLQERARGVVRPRRQVMGHRIQGLQPRFQHSPVMQSVPRTTWFMQQPTRRFTYRGDALWQQPSAGTRVYMRGIDGGAVQRPFAIQFRTEQGQIVRPHILGGPVGQPVRPHIMWRHVEQVMPRPYVLGVAPEQVSPRSSIQRDAEHPSDEPIRARALHEAPESTSETPEIPTEQ